MRGRDDREAPRGRDHDAGGARPKAPHHVIPDAAPAAIRDLDAGGTTRQIPALASLSRDDGGASLGRDDREAVRGRDAGVCVALFAALDAVLAQLLHQGGAAQMEEFGGAGDDAIGVVQGVADQLLLERAQVIPQVDAALFPGDMG